MPVDLRGVATLAPSATDQVLLVAAHGAYWNAVHPMRWVADLHVLLRSPIDWPRLERLAVERELTAPLAHALAYVGDRFAAPVPDGVVGPPRGASGRGRCGASPTASRRCRRRRAARPGCSPSTSTRTCRGRGNAATARRRAASCVFLQHHLEVDDRRQLVARMGRGARRNAGLAPRGRRAHPLRRALAPRRRGRGSAR